MYDIKDYNMDVRTIVFLVFIFLSGSLVTAGELTWPLSCSPGQGECFGNVGFPDIDGDNIANHCGPPGYRLHQGTDLAVSASGYQNGVDVLAAADGRVKWVFDGKYDNCPSFHPDCMDPPAGWFVAGQSNGYRVCTDYTDSGNFYCFDGGNVVVVEHPLVPGVYATRYGHFKNGSITVQPGDEVSAGGILGQVASAGRSSGPHLHFEVWEAGNYDLVDPWPGVCGSPQVQSLWKYETPWLPPLEHQSSVWRQISFPAVKPANANMPLTVANTVADDFGIANYGRSWVVYSHNSATNGYTMLPLDSELVIGQGYWILQNSGAAIELDTPYSQEMDDILSYHNACAADNNRCFLKELSANRNRVSWVMLGNPYLQSLDLGSLRVAAANTPCENGCTLTEANSANLVHDRLYAYSGGADYTVLDQSDVLERWQSAWIAIYPAATSVTLLFAP